jgi:Fe(3+) dicitrate transport protein
MMKPAAWAVLAAFAPLAPAQQAAEKEVLMPRVDIIGQPENLRNIPGSGEIVDRRSLETSRVFTANEALRQVSGVNARDEEGLGLRPNVGIRGLNPTRSTKVTLLEDGIPLAYAPYGDNASYYHPPIDRFERIEVLKGAGQVLYGPQTIGGAINYITPTPPQQFGGFVQATAGNRNYFNGKVNVGGKGMLLDYTRKQGDGAKDNVDTAIDDLNFKYVLGIGTSQAVTLRANYLREDSTVTYTGITDAEFANFGARYNPFKNDKFDIERYGLSATHELDFGGGATLLTNLYLSDFSRDWWRQSSTTTDAQCGFSAARAAGTAVNPDACNSFQGRLRNYYTWGVEPRLTVAHGLGELQAGIKAHFEEQDRKQINGTSPTARSGTLAEDNLRKTRAYSAFASNRFALGQWSMTPALRYESIDSERTNRLTGATGSDSLQAWIPSLGLTWNPGKALTVFGGVHRGFAPPRTEDIIGGSGTSTDVGAEQSTNWELGVRSQPLAWTSLQASVFRNDFKRLIAVGSIAGGSTPLAEGKVLFQGLEISAQADHPSGLFGRLAYTWLPTAEQKEAFRQVVGGAPVAGSAAGKRQPYAPENMLTAALGYGAGPFRGQIEAQYVGEQFADFANTESPVAGGNGQVGKLASYTVWNAALNYALQPKGATVFVTVKNLTDKTYVVDRTRGILVGSPRLVQAGLRYNF